MTTGCYAWREGGVVMRSFFTALALGLALVVAGCDDGDYKHTRYLETVECEYRGMKSWPNMSEYEPTFLLHMRKCMEKKGYRISLRNDDKPTFWLLQTPYEKGHRLWF